jgi:hypothetical protein
MFVRHQRVVIVSAGCDATNFADGRVTIAVCLSIPSGRLALYFYEYLLAIAPF